MKLYIEWGHWIEYENYNGTFCCVEKDSFVGVDADITRGQEICYSPGYTWRWESNKRSNSFKTKQECFDDAFAHLYVECPANERTETIVDWINYAQDNNVSDAFVIGWDELQQG